MEGVVDWSDLHEIQTPKRKCWLEIGDSGSIRGSGVIENPLKGLKIASGNVRLNVRESLLKER
jgi:hypothetical protein